MLKTAPPKVKNKRGGFQGQGLPRWAREHLQSRERSHCHPTAAAAAGTVLRPGRPQFHHAAGQPHGAAPGHCPQLARRPAGAHSNTRESSQAVAFAIAARLERVARIGTPSTTKGERETKCGLKRQKQNEAFQTIKSKAL